MALVAAITLAVGIALTGLAAHNPTPVTSSALTCNYPLWAVPPVTDTVTLRGTSVTARVGLNHDLGGVGVRFELINNAAPLAPLDILEARSAGGSGWQTSYLLTDQGRDQIIVFNQAAGNSGGAQWGYRTRYRRTAAGLEATGWCPIWSDHFHPHRDFGIGVSTSPCGANPGYHFEDGRLRLLLGTVPTAHGRVVQITSEYAYRSRSDQAWASWACEQAFYLNKSVARRADLRVYLCGRNDAWREGPIRPADDYTIRHGIGACDGAGCHFHIDPLAYALLVWQVGGRDVGVAITRPDPFDAHLNMAKTGISGAGTSDAYGSIDWHSVLAAPTPVRIAQGAERRYGMTYSIGTLPQLADLGFTVTPTPLR